MKTKFVITASITVLLLFSTYATSGENELAILANVDSPDMHILESDEIRATRGQYFSSFQAAAKFCLTSYPGCVGGIKGIRRVGGPWQYRPTYVVKSALTGKYLKY